TVAFNRAYTIALPGAACRAAQRGRSPVPPPLCPLSPLCPCHVFHKSSKTPVSRFFRTPSHVKQRPFIAMYTPGGSSCTNDRALPRLNNPSELPNAYGIIAPVRTIVFPERGASPAARAPAVSTIVSVPC